MVGHSLPLRLPLHRGASGYAGKARRVDAPPKVCGVRVEDVDNPLTQKIRYLDKLVDELAKGKPMDKVLRA